MKNVRLIDLFESNISGEWGSESCENENDVEVIRSTNFSDDIRFKIGSETVTRNVEFSKIDSKKLQYGDIIVEKSGGSPTQPVGRILYYDFNDQATRLCNNFTSILRPADDNDSKYLAYLLLSLYRRGAVLKFQNKTTGIINLKLKDYLESIKVNIPPLETQKKIVEALDKAQALIDARKEQIRLMDELVKSRFVEMFGDPISNPHNHNVYLLGELCSDIVDCPHSTPKNYVESSSYPAIRTTELKNGRIDWSEMRYVTAEEYSLRTKRLVPKENDIVYGREGSYGEAVLLPSGYQFCLGQRVMLLRSNEVKCYPEFLWYSVRSDYVYQQAKSKNIGATVGHVNVADVKKFRIMLPNKTQQNEFILFLKKTDEIRDKAIKGFDELTTTQQALMQQYFG